VPGRSTLTIPMKVIVHAMAAAQKATAGIHAPNGRARAAIIFVVATEYIPSGKTIALRAGPRGRGSDGRQI